MSNPTAAFSSDTNPEEVVIKTSHGVVPSGWIRALPSPLRAPIVFCYCELLRPDDDFRQELRKTVIFLGTFLSAVPAAQQAVNLATAPEDDWRVGAAWARFQNIPMIILWWVIYFVCRHTGHASARLIDAWLLTTTITIHNGIITSTDYPWEMASTLTFIMAMLGRTSWLPLHAVLLLTGNAVAHYNVAVFARGEPEAPIVALPGYLMRDLWVRLFNAYASYGSILFVMAGLQLQMMESDRQTVQASANSEVALDIAEALARYDTAGALAVLKRDDSGEDECLADPKLVHALEILVTNLEKYRPHLPNWLLAETTGSSIDDDDLSSLHSDCRDSTGAAELRRKLSASYGKALNGDDGDQPTTETTRRSSEGRGDNARVQAKHLTPNVARSYTATIAHVYFGVDDAASDLRSMIISTFVDRVYTLARATGGAVHSFVGNLLTVSWNSANRVVQHEVKAARFLTQLRDDPGHGAVGVGGAMGTGRVTVQLAGGGESSALTVEAAWLPVLESAALFGAETWSFVATTSACREMAHRFATQPATVIVASNGARLGPSAKTAVPDPVHLLHELKTETAEGNDEWMYVLEQREHAAAMPHNVAPDDGAESAAPPPASVAAIAAEVRLLSTRLVPPDAETGTSDASAVVRGVRDRCELLKAALGNLGDTPDDTYEATSCALKHLLHSATATASV